MREKWKAGKKGYLKIHIAVDGKTKKILSIKVTDEHVHDSKALPGLVEDIVKSDSMATVAIGKLLFGDGAYEGNEVLDIWETMDMPCIKVRKNAEVRLKKGHILRNLSVIAQKNDLQKLKDSVSYGQIWIVETVFSSFKDNVWIVCLFC